MLYTKFFYGIYPMIYPMFQTSTDLFTIAGLKNSKTFCRDEPLSFFQRFLNSKFSNRFDFTWTFIWKNHIIFYLRMLTQSLWSEGPFVWTCNFHQMHLVIKDDNSFQSLLVFPDLNLVLNLHLILTWHHVTWLKCF